MREQAPTKQMPRRVPLVVKETVANEVRVTGDFLGWDKEGIRLSYDGTGVWRTFLRLDPGEYQYRLLVDGEWQDHADATGRIPNPFGTQNCVLTVL